MSKIKLWENTHFDKIIAVYADGTEEEIGYINDDGERIYYADDTTAIQPRKFRSEWNQRQYDAYKKRQTDALNNNGRSPSFPDLIQKHSHNVVAGAGNLLAKVQQVQNTNMQNTGFSYTNPVFNVLGMVMKADSQFQDGILEKSSNNSSKIPYQYRNGEIVLLSYSDTLKYPYKIEIILGDLKKSKKHKRYINSSNGTVIYLTEDEANSKNYKNLILTGILRKDPLEKSRDEYWNDLVRMMNDPKTRKALEEASQKTGMKLEDLMVMALIESNGNRLDFGYTGLMQMGKKATIDVNKKFDSQITFNKVENDVFFNALAGAAYMKLTKAFLEEEGYIVSVLNLYLSYQLGQTGFQNLMNTLKTNPNSPITSNQSTNKPNGYYEQKGKVLTQQEYYNGWIIKTNMIHELVQEYLYNQ